MEEKGYYIPQKTRLLDSFEKTAGLVKDFVTAKYGGDLADDLQKDALQEFDALIPDMPHVKERRGAALNSFLLITAQEIALYKSMKKHGKTPSEAWEICHEALTLGVNKVPGIKRWLMKQMMYSPILRRRLQKLQDKGKTLGFGDFEIKYVHGDDKNFDFGIDYIKCGNYEFAKEQGVEEFAPYICMSDIALSEALNWGLIRTGTLADGCDRCDFRFKQGGQTCISSKTPEVQMTIDRISKTKFKIYKY